jgi:hypothetical protein
VEPTVLQAATATMLIHAKDMRKLTGAAPMPLTKPGGPLAAPKGAEVVPVCPVCHWAMRDQRTTKRGNQPDYKCSQRTCDGAVWLDRKKNGNHH